MIANDFLYCLDLSKLCLAMNSCIEIKMKKEYSKKNENV